MDRGEEIVSTLHEGDNENRKYRCHKLELLRMAIPRKVYSYKHMDYIAAALKNVYERRNEIRSGYEIVWEPEILRHFTVKLKKK